MTTSLSRVEGPGDAELIAAVRGGDVDAYGDLFARHVDSARRLARQIAGAADADDLVSDAFTKVLVVLQRGGGPDLAFRAYLLTAVRRLHVDRLRSGARLRPVGDLTPFDPGLPFHDTAVEGFENAAAARAFATLPERWQMVLWHTEVEQQKPADIAPLLGMSANSVSALAYRAREGLRQAFLSQHAADPDDIDCAWTRDHLGAYIRGGLSRRDASRVDDHIEGCRACAAVYLELTEVNSGLAGLLAPLLLGTAGLGYIGSGGHSGVPAGLTAAKTWLGAHASLSAVGGVALTATAVVAVYAASHLGGHPSTPQGDPPPHNRPVASSSHTPGQGPHPTPHRHGPVPAVHHTHGPGRTGDLPAPADSTSLTPGTPTSSTSQPTSEPTSQSTSPSSEPTSEPTSQPTSQPTAQTITFTSNPPSGPAFGSTYDVSATGGGSGKPVAYSIDPLTTNNACTLTGSTVTFAHAGSCVIAADQAGNPDYEAAHAVQTVEVPKVAQTIAFTSTVPSPAFVGTTYDVAATGGDSGNPVVFGSTTPGVCTAAASTVTFSSAGACTIEANQAGDADHDAATTATQVVNVTHEFDLAVTAVPGDLNGQDQQITVTVSGMPDTGVATLTASGPADLHHIGIGAPCPCTVNGPGTTFTFAFNILQTPDAAVTFTVSTTDGSIDPDPANDTVTLQFPTTAQRSFAFGLQD